MGRPFVSNARVFAIDLATYEPSTMTVEERQYDMLSDHRKHMIDDDFLDSEGHDLLSVLRDPAAVKAYADKLDAYRLRRAGELYEMNP